MQSTSPQSRVPDVNKAPARGIIRGVLGKYGIQLALLALVIILGLSNGNFRQFSNLQSIITQASFTGIVAVGMTLIIIAGAFDLSVATMLALCATGGAMALPSIGAVPAIAVVILIGIGLGLLNGLVVTKAHIPAFITTLGLMYVYQTIDLVWTNGNPVSITDTGYLSLGTGTLLDIPIPFLAMIAAFLAGYAILRYTTYGRYLRAVGSNETAARVSGIPVDRVLIFGFVLVGVFTAIASVLLSAELSSVSVTMASGYELNVIAIVVVGGTSLAGGQGTMLGSFTGALIFAVIYNALDLFNVASFWQYIAIGVVLIVALASESGRSRMLRGFDRGS
jgi:ribose/xylose/arabinose/galactoside ABC-type transport system permease subunit